MDDSENSPARDVRIVVLSQDASLAWPTAAPGEPVAFAHTSSGYEAAAELLAAPTTALVIDLRFLAGRHLKLLEVARDLGVAVFGVGSLPIGMTAEDLSGVRLVARRDLPQAVAALAPAPSPRPAPPEPAEAKAEAPPRPGPAQPAPSVHLTPAKTQEPDDAAMGEPAGSGPLGADALLASVGLPPAIEKALRGSGGTSRGEEARRGADARTGSGPEVAQGDADRPAKAPAPVAEEATDGLLSPAELNALLGDET